MNCGHKGIILKAIIVYSFLAILLFCLTWTMEQESEKLSPSMPKNSILRAVIARKHDQYNKEKVPLLTIPDLLASVFTNQAIPIETAVQNALRLGATCKQLNLARLGTLLRVYPIEDRNAVMAKLQRYLQCGYACKRNALQLLLYAHAQPNVGDPEFCYQHSTLLYQASCHNDDKMVQLLFTFGADPHENFLGNPTFWSAKNSRMLQLFIAQGVDLRKCGKNNTNALWEFVWKWDIDVHLMKFYLDQGVSPRLLDQDNGESILHHAINWTNISSNRSIDPRMLKIELLLSTIPDMVNTPNNAGETPLDCARHTKHSQEVIALFRQYGARTSAELEQEDKTYVPSYD